MNKIFNLKNTPKGNLIVEFYNEYTSDFFSLFSHITRPDSLYIGTVKDCNVFPNAINNLHKRCEQSFTHVKIYNNE